MKFQGDILNFGDLVILYLPHITTLTSTSCTYFRSNRQLPLLNKRKEKRKYVDRPGIEPRTSGLRVRCPTDCATRPGCIMEKGKFVCGGGVLAGIYINFDLVLLLQEFSL